MTPEVLQKVAFFRPHVPQKDYDAVWLRGQPFKRLTLTLSARGWTANVQWQGTCAIRGEGKTQEEAIQNAVNNVKTEWGCSTRIP